MRPPPSLSTAEAFEELCGAPAGCSPEDAGRASFAPGQVALPPPGTKLANAAKIFRVVWCFPPRIDPGIADFLHNGKRCVEGKSLKRRGRSRAGFLRIPIRACGAAGEHARFV